MSWSKSLIKLATYEVETLQKRLSEVRDRKAAAEAKLARLDEEGRAEIARADAEPAAGLYRIAFLQALAARKDSVRAEIAAIELEEQGARDALAQAFEEQKKYEQVAETARILELRTQARRETAMLDELGLRQAAR
jgi:flagellar FliJ protein